MDDNDYLALEGLLGKLHTELKHRFAISCSTHDSYYIAIYDNVTGERKADKITETIKKTVKELNNGE
jgi:hypothetical protein